MLQQKNVLKTFKKINSLMNHKTKTISSKNLAQVLFEMVKLKLSMDEPTRNYFSTVLSTELDKCVSTEQTISSYSYQ